MFRISKHSCEVIALPLSIFTKSIAHLTKYCKCDTINL
nr:MAG TPA: hypothetical protein [Caudoviricetes sp.]